MSDIDARVKEIVAGQLGVKPDRVTPEAAFIDDLGADSLDVIELVMCFEETFAIEIADEELDAIVTVGDLIGHLEARR